MSALISLNKDGLKFGRNNGVSLQVIKRKLLAVVTAGKDQSITDFVTEVVVVCLVPEGHCLVYVCHDV